MGRHDHFSVKNKCVDLKYTKKNKEYSFVVEYSLNISHSRKDFQDKLPICWKCSNPPSWSKNTKIYSRHYSVPEIEKYFCNRK